MAQFINPVALQERVEQLLDKKETDGLNDREGEELAHYYILEHIVRLAKSRTRLRLAKHQA
ncbi:hypothetical protein [Spirosoma spitsbergense]|uniref:hypothetical protein n=1 Tax=Spirosoma spitsbergense TaxID=431554 RepID=UPI0003824639|nr:hypothetical protein [Spirosoma spitsbergense]